MKRSMNWRRMCLNTCAWRCVAWPQHTQAVESGECVRVNGATRLGSTLSTIAFLRCPLYRSVRLILIASADLWLSSFLLLCLTPNYKMRFLAYVVRRGSLVIIMRKRSMFSSFHIPSPRLGVLELLLLLLLLFSDTATTPLGAFQSFASSLSYFL